MDRRREIFANVPAERPQVEQSFEELRIQDYIRAYTTTGHPPQPCPVQPIDKAQREQAGLPPHIEPHVEVSGIPAPPSECAAAGLLLANLELVTGPPLTDLAALPEEQIFRRTPDANESGNKVYLQSLVCQSTFSNFSPEELRVRAYSVGKIYLPDNVNRATVVNGATGAEDQTTQLQSISTNPLYSQHSVEELRLAYLRTNSELTSEQISQMRIL